MMIFEAIDAGHGDAILLRYRSENVGRERVMLIDGGPKSARNEKGDSYIPYQTRIIPRLMELRKERGGAADSVLPLDLVVCTHIDDDHIAGIERLYGCLSKNSTCAKDGDKVDGSRLWFNSFSDLLGDAVDIKAALAGVPVQAVAASVGQGENTTRFALACGAEINADAPGTLIAVGQQPKDLQPAKVTILNPGERSLTRLRKEWLKKVEEMKKKDPTGVPAGAGGVSFAPDNAIANLSSIVMLVEAFGRRVLLTGDQLSLDILDGLESAQRWKKGQTFHVDIMKVPHHGSTANVQSEFVAAITADIYVFSANGKDQNPDPPVLELIADEAKKGRKFTMAFTNGAMNYETDKKGNFGKIRGTPVKTLAEAIAELKKDPDVAKNVTFMFRDPAKHSLVFPLAPKP